MRRLNGKFDSYRLLDLNCQTICCPSFLSVLYAEANQEAFPEEMVLFVFLIVNWVTIEQKLARMALVVKRLITDFSNASAFTGNVN